jgi:hypothetical protein
MLKRARMRKDDVKTSFYVPRAHLRELKRRAAVENVSLRVVLLRAVDAFLATPPTKEDA